MAAEVGLGEALTNFMFLTVALELTYLVYRPTAYMGYQSPADKGFKDIRLTGCLAKVDKP